MALALGHPVGRPLVGKLIREVRDQLNLGAFDLETAPATFPLADWHTGFHLVNSTALGGRWPKASG